MANIYSGPKYRCKKCDDVVQSMHRHDFRWCKCGAMAIDGGSSYTKLVGNPEDYEPVCKCIDVDENKHDTDDCPGA